MFLIQVTFTNIFSFYGLKSLNALKIAANNFQGDVARYLFNNLTFLGHLDMSYCRVGVTSKLIQKSSKA